MSTADGAREARGWPAVAVAVAACLPYVETPWFGFVAFDDPGHVTRNPVVGRGLTPGGVAWAFGIGADPATDGWFNWPLTWLSHMADVTLFGAWAGGHHLVNVAIHAVNALLVLALGRGLGLPAAGATFAAVVFAVHPAQVESVAWVSERKTVLCAALMFLSMLGYLRWRGLVAADGAAGGRALAWWAVWNVLGVLALLAKPLAVTLPCVLLLLDAVPLGRLRATGVGPFLASLARCLPEKLPLVAAVAATCAWTITMQADAGALVPLPPATRAAHAVVAYATYLRVFLWPAGLGAIHQHPGLPAPAVCAGSAALLLAACGLVVVASRRGLPLVPFGWLWFLGTLVPMIGIVQVGSNGWSDRYLYVPIMGLAVGAATLLERGAVAVHGRRWSWPDGLAGPVLAAWIAGLTVLAWWQAGQWRDTATLAARTLASHPARTDRPTRPGDDTARWYGFTWLAADALERRDLAAAERWLLEAERIPEFPQKEAFLQAQFGRLLLDTGRDAEAARRFARAIELEPRDPPARIGLGLALLRSGEAAAAAEVFRALVAERPGLPLVWVGLASALLELGRAAEALACCDRALGIAPRDRAALAVREAARAATRETAEHPR